MTGLKKLVRRWLDQFQELEAGLPIYRVIVAGYVLLIMLPSGTWLREVPNALLFPPPGTPSLVGSVPPGWLVDVLTVALAICGTFLLLGASARWAALGLGGILLTLNTWMYAFGKIDHDILLIVVLFLFAFSNWAPERRGSQASHNSDPRRGWLTGVLALAIALSMFSAALPKLFTGWLRTDTSASRYFFLQNHHVTGRSGPLTDAFLSVDSPLFWIAADLATVLLEGGMLFLIFTPRLFRIACAVAAIFHLGIWAIMDIAFHHNVLAYAAFVRWDPVARKFPSTSRFPLPHIKPKEHALLIGMLGFGLGLITVLAENPFTILQRQLFGAPVVEPFILIIGGAVGVAYLLFRVVRSISGDFPDPLLLARRSDRS